MAFTSLITAINNGSYSALTGDNHSYFDTGILTGLSLYTEIDILFVPVFAGAGAPYAMIYAIDINSNLVPLRMMGLTQQNLVLNAAAGIMIQDKLQVKVFSGVSTPPVVFSLSITVQV